MGLGDRQELGVHVWYGSEEYPCACGQVWSGVVRGRGNRGPGGTSVGAEAAVGPGPCGLAVGDPGMAWGTSWAVRGTGVCLGVQPTAHDRVQPEWGQLHAQTRLGRAAVCPTGVCWRQRGRPTRRATSSGWVRTAGAPRSHLCCTWRRWRRALSLSSPRGCPCEVGPRALTLRPLLSPPLFTSSLPGPWYCPLSHSLRLPPSSFTLVCLLPWPAASLC